MPFIDDFPPLFVSKTVNGVTYPLSYYSSATDPASAYYTNDDFVKDPYQMGRLGISTSTLLRPDIYTPDARVHPINPSASFPLNDESSFANLLRQDDAFVKSLVTNAFLLTSLGIAPITLLSSASIQTSSISSHVTSPSSFTTLLARDSAFGVSLVDFRANQNIVYTNPTIVTRNSTDVQRALSASSVLSQLLTALQIPTSYRYIVQGRTYRPSASFKTQFNKDFSSLLNLDSNSLFINLDSDKEAIKTKTAELETLIVTLTNALKYDQTGSYVVFDGEATGDRTVPITYSTRAQYGIQTVIGDPLLDPSNFSLANLFYNRNSLIQNLTSINIDTFNARITSLSVVGTNGSGGITLTDGVFDILSSTIGLTSSKFTVISSSFNILSSDITIIGGTLSTLSCNAVFDTLKVNSLTGDTITYTNLTRIDKNGITIPSEFLPLTGGKMSGSITLVNDTKLDQGYKDTGRNGLSGISLVAGYDLNWQAGWLASYDQDRKTNRPLYIDSGAGTTVRVWSGVDAANGQGTEISHTGLTADAGLFKINLTSRGGVYADKFYTIGAGGVPVEFVGSGGSASLKDPLTITGISCTNLTAINALITNLTAINLSATNITVQNISSVGTFYYTTLQKIDANGTAVPTPDTDNISCTNLTAINAKIDNLTSTNLFVSNSSFFNVNINDARIYAIGLSAENLYAYNQLSATSVLANTATISVKLNVTEDLVAKNTTSTKLTATEYIQSLNLSSKDISGVNLYISTSTKLPSLTTTPTEININSDLRSTKSISTTNNISAAFIYGTVMGKTFTAGDDGNFLYLSARRADINDLTVYPNSVIIDVPVLDVDGNPTFDTNGDPIMIGVPSIIGGTVNTASAFMTHAAISEACFALNLTSNNITSTESIILSSESGVSFYATTANQIGVNILPTSSFPEFTVGGSISATSSISAYSLYITDNILTSSLSTVTLSSTTLLATQDISSLSGIIYGTFNDNKATAVNLFNNVSIISLSTTSITANTATALNFSAIKITTESEVISGNSDLWSQAYYVPITINLIIDGSGSPIQPDIQGKVEIPYNIKLSSWAIYSDVASQTSYTTVTVLSTNYDEYPSTTPLYVTPSDIPFISLGEVKNTANITTDNWKINLLKGDIIQFGLVPETAQDGSILPTSATNITLSLRGTRSLV